MSSIRAGTASTVGALLVVLTAPGGSTAAAPPRHVGELFVPTSGCFNVTMLQTSLPGNADRVPGTGVITSMRTVLGSGGSPTTLTFKVARAGTAAGRWRAVGSSPAITVQPETVVQRNVRIPTRAGDVLGFYLPEGTCFHQNSATGYQMSQLSAELSATEASFAAFNGYHVPIEGTWEPDADRDRFGDRTQDACPTDPTTHASCAASRPRTQITSVAVAANGTVRIRFRANERSTFRCAVDSPVFGGCRSPLVRRLAPGRHTIAVVATDRYGNRDATPAIARVSVPRR